MAAWAPDPIIGAVDSILARTQARLENWSHSMRADVLGHRLLHAVVSEGEDLSGPSDGIDPAAATLGPTGNPGPASPSERQTAIWLTDQELSWLGEYVGHAPVMWTLEPGQLPRVAPAELDPAQTIYDEISRALQDLRVMDEGGRA